MVIGALRLTLHIAGGRSLKAKRQVVRSLIEHLCHRFNAAVAEVGAQDDHRRAVIGATVVSGDSQHADSMLSALVEAAHARSKAPIVDVRTELIFAGEDHGTW